MNFFDCMTDFPNVNDCTLITLPQVGDRNGHITAINGHAEIPFEVKRVFYIYDIPSGESRGAHAHKKCHQFITAASGAFEVLINDGKSQKVISLSQPNVGIHVPPMIWASEINFSSGAICLVLTSHEYDETDYLRDFEEYLESKRVRQNENRR